MAGVQRSGSAKRFEAQPPSTKCPTACPKRLTITNLNQQQKVTPTRRQIRVPPNGVFCLLSICCLLFVWLLKCVFVCLSASLFGCLVCLFVCCLLVGVAFCWFVRLSVCVSFSVNQVRGAVLWWISRTHRQCCDSVKAELPTHDKNTSKTYLFARLTSTASWRTAGACILQGMMLQLLLSPLPADACSSWFWASSLHDCCPPAHVFDVSVRMSSLEPFMGSGKFTREQPEAPQTRMPRSWTS